MNEGRYILKGREVIPEPDLMKWGKTLEKDRRVGYDVVNDKRVSTVFLGLDHQFGDGPPILFETMVFPLDKYNDQYCERYSTYGEAKAGHARIVQALKDGTLELYADSMEETFPPRRNDDK